MATFWWETPVLTPGVPRVGISSCKHLSFHFNSTLTMLEEGGVEFCDRLLQPLGRGHVVVLECLVDLEVELRGEVERGSDGGVDAKGVVSQVSLLSGILSLHGCKAIDKSLAKEISFDKLKQMKCIRDIRNG